MNTPDRVIKTKVPARVIVSATLIGLFVIGFIIVAVWQSGRGITEARMSGTIVAKEFQPLQTPERQITLNRDGALSATNSTGQFVLTVEVPQGGNTTKTFTVWLNDKAQYDSLKIGDRFDVGPYVVPEKK
jgi:hypothetical protein